MIGGVIGEIVEVNESKWWVNCMERPYSKVQECAVYVDPGGHPLRVGDMLWWQGRVAFWTPRVLGTQDHDISRGKVETQLDRIGYSGAERPALDREGGGVMSEKDKTKTLADNLNAAVASAKPIVDALNKRGDKPLAAQFREWMDEVEQGLISDSVLGGRVRVVSPKILRSLEWYEALPIPADLRSSPLGVDAWARCYRRLQVSSDERIAALEGTIRSNAKDLADKSKSLIRACEVADKSLARNKALKEQLRAGLLVHCCTDCSWCRKARQVLDGE